MHELDFSILTSDPSETNNIILLFPCAHLVDIVHLSNESRWCNNGGGQNKTLSVRMNTIQRLPIIGYQKVNQKSFATISIANIPSSGSSN